LTSDPSARKPIIAKGGKLSSRNIGPKLVYVVFLNFKEATNFNAINHFVCLELNVDKFQWNLRAVKCINQNDTYLNICKFTGSSSFAFFDLFAWNDFQKELRQESPLGILTGHSDPPHP